MVLTPDSESVNRVLGYFDKFNYPLTLREIWYWQENPVISYSGLKKFLSPVAAYYYLTGREALMTVRRSRNRISRAKLVKAQRVVNLIQKFPFVRAIFITGALAMQNSPPDDDIDIFIVVSENSLWITRLLVILLLRIKKWRRDPHLPEHSSARVSDKICDNLWLDTDHLALFNRNLFTAHELLQAKCLYDSGGIYKQLLMSNSWARDFLPIAYRQSLKNLASHKSYIENQKSIFDFILYLINLFLFTMQYVYMRPRLTAEKIGLGYAFFHPRTGVV